MTLPQTTIATQGPPAGGLGQRTILLAAAVTLLAASAVVAPVNGARAQDPLAKPAFDETLFKDGAIRMREQQFGAWYLKCQEIIKVRQRVCNMLSMINDSEGNALGSALIATNDAGEPTMMLSIAAPIHPDRPITLETSFETPGKKKKMVKVAHKRTVKAFRCDTTCKFIFPFESKLAFALNTGSDLSITTVVRAEPAAAGLKPSDNTSAKTQKGAPLALVVKATGFAAALTASTETWEP